MGTESQKESMPPYSSAGWASGRPDGDATGKVGPGPRRLGDDEQYGRAGDNSNRKNTGQDSTCLMKWIDNRTGIFLHLEND